MAIESSSLAPGGMLTKFRGEVNNLEAGCKGEQKGKSLRGANERRPVMVRSLCLSVVQVLEFLTGVIPK